MAGITRVECHEDEILRRQVAPHILLGSFTATPLPLARTPTGDRNRPAPTRTGPRILLASYSSSVAPLPIAIAPRRAPPRDTSVPAGCPMLLDSPAAQFEAEKDDVGLRML
jgi:hypothetical protein